MSLEPHEKRARLHELKKEVRELERPEREARKIASAKAKRERGKADRGRERDNGFLAFLRRQPCCVGHVLGGCDGHVDAAHIRFGDAKAGRVNPGMSVKPSDRWATPLCRVHHTAQHGRNERAWWQEVGLDPTEISRRLFAEYSTPDPAVRSRA